MKFLKLIVVLFVGLIAVVAVTWTWIQRITAKTGPAAVDITYLAQRPLYLLELAVILALAGLAYWRWAFSYARTGPSAGLLIAQK